MIRTTLALASALTLLGWGMLHIFWDVPYRSLLWDEEWLRPFVEQALGFSWNEWVTGSTVEAWINGSIRALGGVLLAGAVLSVAPVRRRYSAPALYASGLILALVAGLLFKENFFRVGMLLEYGCQVGAPLLLLMRGRRWLALRVCVATTFLGHGLYAIGYYPVPGHFVDMMIDILGVSEGQALAMLKVAGVMDLVVCVAVFVPRVAAMAMLYAAAWGLLTCAARPVAALFNGQDLVNTSYWVLQAFCRVPHFLVPAAGWLMISGFRLDRGRATAPESSDVVGAIAWARDPIPGRSD